MFGKSVAHKVSKKLQSHRQLIGSQFNVSGTVSHTSHAVVVSVMLDEIAIMTSDGLPS